MEYRNYRNRKGQTGLAYHAPIKSEKLSEIIKKTEPADVNRLARYTLMQSIAAAVILIVITGIRLISSDTYQDVQTGINGQGVAGAHVSNAAEQVMRYMQESETFSQLFPNESNYAAQGDGAVWTSTILSDCDLVSLNTSEDFVCPVMDAQITSGYGYRTDPFSGEWIFHKGLDMAVPERSRVYSAGDGTVVVCTYDEVGGWYVVVDHGAQLQTYYGHLSKILVNQGELVEKGQVIALSGNSGNTTGPHLHFEVRDQGQNVDPSTYIHV